MIKRFNIQLLSHRSDGKVDWEAFPDPNGKFVLYEDHLNLSRQAEDIAHADGYEEGYDAGRSITLEGGVS